MLSSDGVQADGGMRFYALVDRRSCSVSKVSCTSLHAHGWHVSIRATLLLVRCPVGSVPFHSP